MTSPANNIFQPKAESTKILYSSSSSTAAMATDGFHVKLGTQRLPTTRVMLENTLAELDNRSGVTLQAIKKHIANIYLIDVSAKRWGLIKKYMREWQSEGVLINVTGHGLVGHLRFVRQKHKQSKTKHSQRQQHKEQQQQQQRQQLQLSSDNELSTPPNRSLAQQVNETQCYAPQVQHDPQAHANSLIHLERVDTPRTSLRGRPLKRHLQPPVNSSQIFELEKRHKRYKQHNAKK